VSSPRRVLIVRNDKLGDFTLALPCYELLERALPGVEAWALVPEYTRELAELAPGISGIVVDPGEGDPAGSPRALARLLREHEFDAVIALYATVRVGLAARLARIPVRVAPASRLAQVFFDVRVPQRRSRVEKPEFEYDLDLVRHYLARVGHTGDTSLARPALSFPGGEVAERRAALVRELGVPADHALVFLHAGHGGSANNLAPGQYANLVRELRSERGHTVVITAGPGEAPLARTIADAAGEERCRVWESAEGLGRFALTIAACDAFIGSSTGPLHIAGALDRPTAGFYVRRRTSSPLRWRTLASDERRLEWFPPEPAHERDMTAIDIAAAAREISARFL
jgi:ADP-heptose:LPS heptosyltransferase